MCGSYIYSEMVVIRYSLLFETLITFLYGTLIVMQVEPTNFKNLTPVHISSSDCTAVELCLTSNHVVNPTIYLKDFQPQIEMNY